MLKLLKSLIRARFGQTPLPRSEKSFKIVQALNYCWKHTCYCLWPIGLTHMCLWQGLHFSPDLINLSLVIWGFESGCGDPCCVCSLAALPPQWTHGYWWEACPETFSASGLKLREAAVFQCFITVINHNPSQTKINTHTDTHTRPCTSTFTKTFTDILDSPAPYLNPNHPN